MVSESILESKSKFVYLKLWKLYFFIKYSLIDYVEAHEHVSRDSFYNLYVYNHISKLSMILYNDQAP